MADQDVVGIDRLLPTQRARLVVFGLVPACIAAFFGTVEYMPRLWPAISALDKMLIAALVMLATASGMLTILAIDLCLVINRSEHTRIIHENYASPYMSFKMLYANATLKHWMFLSLFGAICMAIGYGYATIP